VGHKKRATLFWTITSAYLDGFQHFVYQRIGIRLKINPQKLKHFNFYVKVKILLTRL